MSFARTHPIDGFSGSIRPPRAEDAAHIWSLSRKAPSLDSNSPYAYLLLCTDFASTGAVAETAGQMVGFVLGYRPPARPESWFIWQIGVREDHHCRGLGGGLLDYGLETLLPDGVAFVEATVTRSNTASWALFRSLARRSRSDCREAPAFPSSLFPDGAHEDEIRIRIGPFDHPESLQPRRA